MKIKAYEAKRTPIPYDDYKKRPPHMYVQYEKWGGFNPETKAITPFKIISSNEELTLQDYLDNMTAAVEQGFVDVETFIFDFFGTDQAAHSFAELLDYEYAETFWVNDRHFNALMNALDSHEEGCRDYSAMAEAFREKADSENQVLAAKKVSAKKPPAKKKTK